MNFNESSIITNYCEETVQFGFQPDLSHVPFIYDATIRAMAEHLGLAKEKSIKTAIVIQDLKGTFLMGGVVTYHPNEDEEMPGNWSFELTFNEEDVKGAKTILSTDTHFQQTWNFVMRNLHGLGQPDGSNSIQPMIETAVKCLSNWLDVNAKEGEVQTIEMPGYFEASVAIENGEKIKSITPDGAMKRLVKGDDMLEN